VFKSSFCEHHFAVFTVLICLAYNNVYYTSDENRKCADMVILRGRIGAWLCPPPPPPFITGSYILQKGIPPPIHMPNILCKFKALIHWTVPDCVPGSKLSSNLPNFLKKSPRLYSGSNFKSIEFIFASS
jgi:hypothetical protein